MGVVGLNGVLIHLVADFLLASDDGGDISDEQDYHLLLDLVGVTNHLDFKLEILRVTIHL